MFRMYKQGDDGEWVQLGAAVSLEDAKELLETCGWLDTGDALYIFVDDEIVSTWKPGSIDSEEAWFDGKPYKPTYGPKAEE